MQREAPTLFFELPYLDPKILCTIYPQGFFPWYSEGEPIRCVSPAIRAILYPKKLRISSRTKRYARQFSYSSRIDSDFDGVIHHCATVKRGKQEGTWITEEIRATFTQLFKMGYAHSFEVYYDGALCGGLYGLWIGRIFYGESMFSLTRHASLVALANLCAFARMHNIQLIDCQIPTPHLLAHGAETISRECFIRLLRNSERIS